jgi:hypothetical protein
MSKQRVSEKYPYLVENKFYLRLYNMVFEEWAAWSIHETEETAKDMIIWLQETRPDGVYRIVANEVD